MKKAERKFFFAARPVWATGKEDEMNCFVRLRAKVKKAKANLIITACNVYRVFVNGSFVASGPARAAHGYFRVDHYSLDHLLQLEENDIVIEAGAYRVNSFEYLDEPGFLQCEILSGETVLAATGVSGFCAENMAEKIQKVQRYSFQRTFCEEYDFSKKGEKIELMVVPERKYLERRVPYLNYENHKISKIICAGSVKGKITREQYIFDRYITNISKKFKGFQIEEMDSFVLKDVQEMDFHTDTEAHMNDDILRDHRYWIYDGGINTTGFLCSEIEVDKHAVLYMIFDEILVNEEIDFTRLTSTNVVKYRLCPGKYFLQTFEPYTLRYLKIVSIGGDCKINNIHLKQVRNPAKVLMMKNDDLCIDRIYHAAVETFLQNAVDIYMDCPSRERAGWLCDSFFMGRVEYFLTGKSVVEKNFMENYLLPESFAHIPEGMLPMCYPADHTDGVFIPNWAMWFVLELEEYKKRSGDVGLTEAFRPRIKKLLEYLEKYENEDGLLENLDGWVFVEWSKCNELTDGVNYPTNMLYAAMLETVGKLYDDFGVIRKAEHIRNVIREQAVRGEFFVEHGLRIDDKIIPQPEITETCQYYAFFFDVADIDKNKKLWSVLLDEFGPTRKNRNNYKNVFFSNAFIGNYLRLCILKRFGYRKKMIQEIKEYFGYMDERTHTLWEHDSVRASCNHGFASYVACLLAE